MIHDEGAVLSCNVDQFSNCDNCDLRKKAFLIGAYEFSCTMKSVKEVQL